MIENILENKKIKKFDKRTYRLIQDYVDYSNYQIDELDDFGGVTVIDNITKAKEMLALWEKAEDVNDFINLVSYNKTLHGSLLWKCIVEEKPDNIWYIIRDCFGSKQFKTYSDAGGLLVGNKQFATLISNGYGDGVTRVCVFDNDNECGYALSFMQLHDSIQGAFNIYNYDCSDRNDEDIVCKCSGKYFVYSYEGLIALVKYAD